MSAALVPPQDPPPVAAWAWILLAPLPVLALAIWRKGVLANVPPDYPEMLLAGVSFLLLAAGAAWLAVGKRWGKAVAPVAAAALPAISFAYYAGAAATLATLLLGVTGLAFGSMIDTRSPVSTSVRLLVGLAMLAALVGWTLPFHVHDARLYLLLIATVCLMRRQAIAHEARAVSGTLLGLAEAHPVMCLLLVAAATVATLGLWLPSLNYDDNASHLILVDQLLAGGYYRMDVSSQVWALAPWSNNVLHAVSGVLAGQESRASINLLWLLLGISGAYRLAEAVGGSRAAALAASAVLASYPLTSYFGSSMQVDGVVAAVLLHLIADLVRAKGRILTPLSTGALLGMLAGLKASNGVYAALPLFLLAWNAVRDRKAGRLLTLVAAALVVGGSSYAYATLVTGNPVFPLFNAVFHSPYFALENFHDDRWSAGLSWRTAWDLAFDTSRFGESYPGAAGIALLALLPAAIVEMVKCRSSLWVGLWILVSAILLFSQIQYLRYVFPAFAILGTLGVVGLSRCLGDRVLALSITLVVAGNVVLMPTVSWIARANPWAALWKEGVSAEASIERSVIPERALLERLQSSAPQACVLMTDQPFVAGASGRVNAMAWYDPRLAQARQWAERDASGIRWQQVLQSVGASHVVLTGQGDKPLLNALAAMGFASIDAEGGAEVWANAAPDKRLCNRRFQQLRDQSQRLFNFGEHAP